MGVWRLRARGRTGRGRREAQALVAAQNHQAGRSDAATGDRAAVAAARGRQASQPPASPSSRASGVSAHMCSAAELRQHRPRRRRADDGANRAIDLIVTKEQGGGGRFGASNDPAACRRPSRRRRGVGQIRALRALCQLGQDQRDLAERDRRRGGDAGAGHSAARRQGRRRRREPGGKALGEHPEGGVITVREGRFGPYVNLGKVNATLPKGMGIDEVNLEEAIRLIEEKGGPVKKKAPAKKAPPRRPPPRPRQSPTKKIADSDGTPFEDAKPVKKPATTAAKKAPAKKVAGKKWRLRSRARGKNISTPNQHPTKTKKKKKPPPATSPPRRSLCA